MKKIQIDPSLPAFQQTVVRRLNAFSEIDAAFTAADTATTFSHGLGKVPQHAILRASDKPVAIYQTTADVAAWTNDSVTLRANNSQVSCVVKLE